jgi:hypothetical protein
MLRIFIGYDPRQAVTYNVCQHSLLIRAKQPVAIIPLIIETLPIKRQGLTPFTWSRFLVPYLSKFEGMSIFIDADIILLDDINELINSVVQLKIDNQIPAVSVVKSKHRFEWASVMVFNCSHPDNLKLSPEFVETTNENLHSISWTNSIGSIESSWNYLVGYDGPISHDLNEVQKVKLVHYTQGVPAWAETQDCEFSEEWKKELMYINSSIEWVDLMGKSIHAATLEDGTKIPKYKLNANR